MYLRNSCIFFKYLTIYVCIQSYEKDSRAATSCDCMHTNWMNVVSYKYFAYQFFVILCNRNWHLTFRKIVEKIAKKCSQECYAHTNCTYVLSHSKYVLCYISCDFMWYKPRYTCSQHSCKTEGIASHLYWYAPKCN